MPTRPSSMPRLLLLLISLAATLFVWGNTSANEERIWTAEDLPIPYLKDARCHVSNPESIISPKAEAEMNSLLHQLEDEKGVQSLVCVVHHVKDGDCYEFGMALARKYGIGSKKQNSGLIIVLSVGDRSYYILTGTGLEGTLPDAICKRIEYTYMVPHFKAQEWDQGMTKAIQAIHGYIQGDPTLRAELTDADDGTEAAFLLLALILVIAIAFFVIVIKNTYRTCSSCGKKRVRAVSQTFIYTRGNWDYYRVLYKCSHCGHSEEKIEHHHHDHDDHQGNIFNNVGSGFIIGGGSGGFGGGRGGFSGGSFGGGSFGGGGAGGRF